MNVGEIQEKKSTLDCALSLRDAGYSVIPFGSGHWLKGSGAYARRLPTEDELEEWFSNEGADLDVFCGGVSRGLRCLDFDNHTGQHGDLFPRWQAKLTDGAAAMLRKLCVFRTKTPGGYRVAWRCDTEHELYGDEVAGVLVDGDHISVIESLTRMRVPGGATQEYQYLSGPPLEKLKPLLKHEQELLYSLARQFHEHTEPERVCIPPGTNIGDRPGDHFNLHASWEEILEPKNWTLFSTRSSGVCDWTRPGKHFGVSARTGGRGHNVLYVWTSSADPFRKNTGYTPFSAYALLYHGGDFSAAAREINERGFGSVPALGMCKAHHLSEMEARVNAIVKTAKPPAQVASLPVSESPQSSDERFKALHALVEVQEQPTIAFETWDETCAIAATQKEDWLLQHWAEFASLVLLTGLPFSGKSVIVSEIIGCLAKKIPFCGIPVQSVPFILMDLENKERILVKRINKALQGCDGDIRKLYHRVKPKNVPRPITNTYIRLCIDALKKKMAGAEKGLLVIDTMRSAFAGAGKKENDNDDMVAILYPLQALAKETGWCILVLHHNNKGSNHYSGGTAIAAAADYLWNWTSDKKKLTGRLEMDGGRDEHQVALEFAFDLDTQRNVFLGTAKDVQAIATKDSKDQHLAAWLTLLSADPAGGKTRDEIRLLALNCGMLDDQNQKRETQDRKVKDVVQEAVLLKYLDSTGRGEKGDPFRYFRTAAGSNCMILSQVTGK